MIATTPTHVAHENHCWITWERHQRSRSLTSQLNIPIVELAGKGSRLRRYLRESLSTIGQVVRRNPDVVFVQVPSIVLGHIVLLLSRIWGFKVVADIHNAVIEGAENAPRLMRWLYRSLIRQVDLVIVTNSALVRRVHALGGNAGILPDPVPAFRAELDATTDEVVVISTWADDEPLRELIEAADLLPSSLSMVITGRPKGPCAPLAERSKRLRLSGFVSDHDYIAMLSRARVIVDLTTREDCLVCGAYEALAVGRPLVVSDSTALRELLQHGALYVANEPASIARAIAEAASSADDYARRCSERREAYITEWRAAASNILCQVQALHHGK